MSRARDTGNATAKDSRVFSAPDLSSQRWRCHSRHGREVRRQSRDWNRIDERTDRHQPGRPGFGHQLGLSYDSGAGNGPFGFGWNLSLPAVARKTDKGLPQYRDATQSDVFVLSGLKTWYPFFAPASADSLTI